MGGGREEDGDNDELEVGAVQDIIVLVRMKTHRNLEKFIRENPP